MKILVPTILLIFFELGLQNSVKCQLDNEEHIKKQAHTGLVFGAHPKDNRLIEIGIGHIFIDKPCNRSHHSDFGPQCSFPKKLQLDIMFEHNLIQKYLYGQRITLLYTPMAWQDNKSARLKYLYYTFGHLLVGVGIVNYTTFKFSHNRIFIRPEVSWMAPQRIHLHGKHNSKSDKLQLNARLVYSYNSGERDSDYPIPQHQFGINLMFLYTRNKNN